MQRAGEGEVRRKEKEEEGRADATRDKRRDIIPKQSPLPPNRFLFIASHSS